MTSCSFLPKEEKVVRERQSNEMENCGNKASGSRICSLSSRKFGLPCWPHEFLSFSKSITIENVVVEENNDLEAQIECYTLQKGRHSSLCLRRTRGANPNQGVLVELFVLKVGETKKWLVQMRSHNWDLEEEGVVAGTKATSTHEWNKATRLNAIAKLANEFGTYKLVTNNCKHFIEKLRNIIISTKPPPDALRKKELLATCRTYGKSV